MNASNNRPVAVAIATLTLLTAAGLGLTLPSRAADDTKKSAPKPALTVTTVQPQTGQLSVRLAANGSIAAWQEAIIGSEANGLRLTEVRVNVGDAVRKGDFSALNTWRRDNIWSRASTLPTPQLIEAATGEPLTAKHFIAHVKKRYGE